MLSTHLTELLDTAGNPDQAAAEIGRYLALREEARAALPALKAVAEHKAGEEGVRAVLGRRFALYPQPERDEGEWAAWWADYFDALADVPLPCLEAAMRAWVQKPDAQFMPKPGELRDLAFRTPSRSLQRYQRAKRAIQLYDQHSHGQQGGGASDDAPEGVAIDHAAAVRKMLAEYNATFAARKPIPRPAAPSTAGKSDERGLTAEMRDLMARRAEQ